MLVKLLLVVGLISSAWSCLMAQEVVVEPPAPAAYSENSPDFMFIKKAVVTTRSSGSYDVVLTLQGELPSKFPEGRSAILTMSFDFDEISPEKSLPENRIPNFNGDLNISFNRGTGSAKFENFPATFEYRKRTWEFKVSNFTARQDTFSFTLRSPFFALHLPSKVVFRTNYMKAISYNQSSGAVTHETAPVSLEVPAAGGLR